MRASSLMIASAVCGASLQLIVASSQARALAPPWCGSDSSPTQTAVGIPHAEPNWPTGLTPPSFLSHAYACAPCLSLTATGTTTPTVIPETLARTPAATYVTLPLPTPDVELAQAMGDALRQAYESRSSTDELLEVANDAVGRYGGVKVRYALVTEGDLGLVIMSVVPLLPRQRDFPYMPYFFWRGEDGAVQYQSWSEEPYRYFFESAPMSARVVRRDGQAEMGLMPAPWGSTGESSYWLLRLEDGNWQQVWSSGCAEQARQWVGDRGGQVYFVGEGIDTLALRSPLPDDVGAARFFMEWRTEKQEYLSLWQRQVDAYARVFGQVLESRMTALTEFMLALTAHDLERAGQRMAVPEVLQQAREVGLDQLRPDEWSVVAGYSESSSAPSLLLLHQTNQGLESPRYRIIFEYLRGRWLIENIEALGQ